jgi:hypothetical protein
MYVRPQLALISKRLRGVRNSLFGWGYEDWWVIDARESRSRGD